MDRYKSSPSSTFDSDSYYGSNAQICVLALAALSTAVTESNTATCGISALPNMNCSVFVN